MGACAEEQGEPFHQDVTDFEHDIEVSISFGLFNKTVSQYLYTTYKKYYHKHGQCRTGHVAEVAFAGRARPARAPPHPPSGLRPTLLSKASGGALKFIIPPGPFKPSPLLNTAIVHESWRGRREATSRRVAKSASAGWGYRTAAVAREPAPADRPKY
ncbi:hypothetical protein EVAR_40213_1 [Eumeta japonica]|uniref:Uncharacterized protein n=1 Tax=Eumeta variegata TaxID=151549 RepID=A0A4C1XBT4_EUMVA|nr:hypothetical protein EVAR_40213_1 [Eumeta japonica]